MEYLKLEETHKDHQAQLPDPRKQRLFKKKSSNM